MELHTPTFLGQEIVSIEETKYKDYSQTDWILLWLQMYGSNDGSHHKDWLLDQIARIAKGTKVIYKVAKWSDGSSEGRFSLDEPSIEYTEWVNSMIDDGYDYYVGIAP